MPFLKNHSGLHKVIAGFIQSYLTNDLKKTAIMILEVKDSSEDLDTIHRLRGLLE